MWLGVSTSRNSPHLDHENDSRGFENLEDHPKRRAEKNAAASGPGFAAITWSPLQYFVDRVGGSRDRGAFIRVRP